MSRPAGGEPDWEAVVPYSGPPSYAVPPAYGAVPPAYGAVPPHGVPGYGAPAWGPPPGWGPPRPSGPQRPGTSIAAAVLAFTLALLTLVGTVYAAAISALLTIGRRPAGGLDGGTPFLQLAVVGALVAGGVLVLGGRRVLLLAATAAEAVLALWWSRVLDDVVPTGLGTQTVLLPSVFGVLAVTAAGLTFAPSARAWARSEGVRRARARGATSGAGTPAGPGA